MTAPADHGKQDLYDVDVTDLLLKQCRTAVIPGSTIHELHISYGDFPDKNRPRTFVQTTLNIDTCRDERKVSGANVLRFWGRAKINGQDERVVLNVWLRYQKRATLTIL